MSFFGISRSPQFLLCSLSAGSYDDIYPDNASNFMNLYGMANLVKVPTCFIDLILTNNVQCFKDKKTIESGLSDFHSMIVTVAKSSFIKRGPRVTTSEADPEGGEGGSSPGKILNP